MVSGAAYAGLFATYSVKWVFWLGWAGLWPALGFGRREIRVFGGYCRRLITNPTSVWRAQVQVGLGKGWEKGARRKQGTQNICVCVCVDQ